jgi:hypothetical protein
MTACEWDDCHYPDCCRANFCSHLGDKDPAKTVAIIDAADKAAGRPPCRKLGESQVTEAWVDELTNLLLS